MTYVVLITIILLITLLATYLVIENNRKKAEQLKKQQLIDRQKHTVDFYKKQLALYVDAKILRPKHSHNMLVIAGNFFVVQAKSEDNLELFESCIESLMTTINNEIAKSHITGNTEILANNMLSFIESLPTSARDYNKEFYSQMLHTLVLTITTPELKVESAVLETADEAIAES